MFNRPLAIVLLASFLACAGCGSGAVTRTTGTLNYGGDGAEIVWVLIPDGASEGPMVDVSCCPLAAAEMDQQRAEVEGRLVDAPGPGGRTMKLLVAERITPAAPLPPANAGGR